LPNDDSRRPASPTVPAVAGRFVLRHFLPIGIVFDAVVGIAWPQPGLALERLHVLPVVIFCIFVCSGLSLDTGEFLRAIRGLKVPLYSVVVVSGLFPAVAFVMGRLFGLAPGDLVGLMIIASAPTTLGSGIILSGLAGGSLPVAILITMVSCISGVFLMPTVLQVTLGLTMRIGLPVGRMMAELGYLIILPTVIGQLLRRPLADPIRRWWGLIRFLPNLLVVVMIFIAISKGSAGLRGQSLSLIAHTTVVAVGLHVVMLGFNYAAGRGMRLPLPALKSLTIVCSQKTLPLSAFVALRYFAGYPTAVVPCLLFYISQILLDSVIAHRWADARPE
jgi:predicted Na+-dependent transporter